ncbi:alpha/beta fold hydrolase [Streptomyces umbrinus]|uniref:alpha/beta fold hydrolase n=1 Tax=Streptomyces umbrinus TaxID=67370 RepID=UPI00340C6175
MHLDNVSAIIVSAVSPPSSAGAGPAVLLLHGIGGRAASLSDRQEGLTASTTIARDAPGCGDSADPCHTDLGDPADAPVDRYAHAAVGPLHGLGHTRAHVVGVSCGGVIATRTAMRHPGVVRSLTLADSTRGSGRTEVGRVGMQRRVEDLACLGSRSFAAVRGPNLLGPDAAPGMTERVVATMAQVRLPGYRGAAEMMAATDHSSDLQHLGVPTLVLVGEHDRVTGVLESRALADDIPGARFAVVPGGGHAVHQENPEGFNAELRTFLESVGA